MEYIDVYDQTYFEVVKRTEKYPITKIEILDHSEYTIYDITDDVVAESDNISISYNQGVQGKFSFDVVNVDGKYTPNENSPFWYGNKIRVYKGLMDIANGNKYLFTKGVYLVNSASSDGDIISVSCTDKFGQITSELGSSCLDSSSKIEAGSTMWDMVNDMFSINLGNDKHLDPTSPIIDDNARTIELGEDIEMSSGTYTGDLILEICNSNRCRCFYNCNGHLVISKTSTDYAYSQKAPVWEFSDDTTAEFLNASVDYDFTSVKNKVTVWGESMDGVSYVATAVNDNPKSPVRVSKVGYRVADTIEDMYGYEQSNVDEFAKMYLEMKSIIGLSVKIDCAMLPHLNIEDVVSVTSSKLAFDCKRFLISEISFSGNKMSISLTNVDSLPAFREIQ